MTPRNGEPREEFAQRRAVYDAAYRAEHRAHIRAREAVYRFTHAEQIAERKQKYYQRVCQEATDLFNDIDKLTKIVAAVNLGMAQKKTEG